MVEPLRQFISVIGVILVLSIAYSTYSSFITTVNANQQFDISAPGRYIKWQAPIYTFEEKPAGEIYYIAYEKGSLFYLENVNMNTKYELTAYLSNDASINTGPRIGALLGVRGNMTLYVSPDVDINKYAFVLFWSDRQQQIIGIANITKTLN